MDNILLAIDIGSTKICAIIAQKDEDQSIKILGTGIVKSMGIRKGVVTNIEQASKSIKLAVSQAKKVAGTHYDSVIVSISGAYAKSVDSYGVINVPGGEITKNEIIRVLQIANQDANIPSEYEKLHILPYNFKLDEQDVEDPLGMNGNRLEVYVHIVIVLKSSLKNLQRTLKLANITPTDIVLSGYASSIAVLNKDEKTLGAAVIDIGGETTDIVIHHGNSLKFNDYIEAGSENITKDLSIALHTTLETAKEIKLKYGSLKDLKKVQKSKISIPTIGDANTKQEVEILAAKLIILSRVKEILSIAYKRLNQRKFPKRLGAGIVLTGGMTKLDGIELVAQSIFKDIHIRIAKPLETNIEGIFQTLKSPEYSTAIGLLLYGAGYSTSYEMDINHKLRYPSHTQDLADISFSNQKGGEVDITPPPSIQTQTNKPIQNTDELKPIKSTPSISNDALDIAGIGDLGEVQNKTLMDKIKEMFNPLKQLF